MRWKKGPKDWSPSGHIPGMPISPEFVDAYLEAALWSSNDQSGEPLDKRFSVDDFSQEVINESVRDCNDFMTRNKKDLDESALRDSRAGFCFWLSRNGHGSGFFDEYEIKDKNIRNRLQESSREYDNEQIIVGGDNKLRFF